MRDNHYTAEEALEIISSTINEVRSVDVTKFDSNEIDSYLSAMIIFRDCVSLIKEASKQRRAKALIDLMED